MTTTEARTLLKAINRRCRRGKLHGADRYGADYATWHVCHPVVADAYTQAAEVFAGRVGRFMPPVFGYRVTS